MCVLAIYAKIHIIYKIENELRLIKKKSLKRVTIILRDVSNTYVRVHFQPQWNFKIDTESFFKCQKHSFAFVSSFHKLNCRQWNDDFYSYIMFFKNIYKKCIKPLIGFVFKFCKCNCYPTLYVSWQGCCSRLELLSRSFESLHVLSFPFKRTVA